ncbi:MAG TPA: sugar phosphate isomerase/epimerase [Candidatus Methanofastidiosa archaeon]|nr:sugar phosphate isomerase/epimerase [Candidatus Methanofastidiosa archaeon]
MPEVSVSSGCFITHDYGFVRRMFELANTDSFELIVYKSILNDLDSLLETFEGFEGIYSLHAPKSAQIMLSSPLFQSNALRLLKGAADIASELGASLMVVHAWDGRYRQLPLDDIKVTIGSLVDYSADMGLGISIEALPSRFKYPGELVRELLSSCEDLTFTLDFEYAATYDMFDNLLEISDRISNVHLRDYNGEWVVDGRRSYLRPGLGNLDFEDIISKLKGRGYSSVYTLEAPYDEIDDLNMAIRRFRSLI